MSCLMAFALVVIHFLDPLPQIFMRLTVSHSCFSSDVSSLEEPFSAFSCSFPLATFICHHVIASGFFVCVFLQSFMVFVTFITVWSYSLLLPVLSNENERIGAGTYSDLLTAIPSGIEYCQTKLVYLLNG